MDLIKRALDTHPNKMTGYSGLLAAVNRRVAAKEPSVSASCYTSFLSVTGGISGMFHAAAPGKRLEDFKLSHVLRGIDIEVLTRGMAEQLVVSC
ncbi:MAG: hypothetical protein ACRDYX_19140 [Egibacteraceae bacterium]|uniref:hypothetical protein n=1 Tax=Novosphingobium sp. TaxID=1874826 RepID=UPI003D6CEDE1